MKTRNFQAEWWQGSRYVASSKARTICGKLESSNVFDKCQPKNQFPITVEDLARSSIWTRHVVHATTKPSGDPELDEVIYSMTLDECEKGWLRGPFSP